MRSLKLFMLAFALVLPDIILGDRAADWALHKQNRIQQAAAKAGSELAASNKATSTTPSQPVYLNSRSKKFVVNGTGIPEVPFDIGESYAGLLPISSSHNETSKLYFWFFPSKAAKARDEIVVWLNGGPGCSSLGGLVTANGPFLWQRGTLAPVPNEYSWSRLSNIVYIEQPVGTGFSQGTVNIQDEIQLAEQFQGFWKNFVDTFDLHGRKVYLTGESYAGMYASYIGDSFLQANSTEYFNLKGVAINDPTIGSTALQELLQTAPYIAHFANVMGVTKASLDHLWALDKRSGYAAYRNKYFQFPAPALPWDEPPPVSQELNSVGFQVLSDANPCWNIYHITDTCPNTYDQLGIVNQGDYEPVGGTVYFQRQDVQKAINAPLIGEKWLRCTGPVFLHDIDVSPGPALDGTLTRLIDTTKNIIIGSGALDFLLPTNGTLFALQNTTWGGVHGFHHFPSTAFHVPAHEVAFYGFSGGIGDLGVWTQERGLTFYEIRLAGHKLPGDSPSAGYRVLQKLLGRITDFSSKAPLFE